MIPVDYTTGQLAPITTDTTGDITINTSKLNFLNILKNPYNVFANASFFLQTIVNFPNNGLGVKWSFWDQIYSPGNLNPASVTIPGAVTTVGGSRFPGFGGYVRRPSPPYAPATAIQLHQPHGGPPTSTA